MRLRRRSTALVLFCALVGGAAAEGVGSWQEQLFKALKAHAVVSGETQLVSANYVCTLAVKNESFDVINTVEYVHGAQVPRANNRILIVDRDFKLRKSISYADQYPLFCRGSRLFVHGDLGIDNMAPYGNTLTFSDIDDVAVTTTDPNDLPIPITSRRATFSLK